MTQRLIPSFKCPATFKKFFNESHCLLTISVGQETHEGERFAATVDLIAASFASCTITLHDSLQRFTIALDKEEEPQFFYDASVIEGDLWLERNEPFYSKLPNLKVIRWESWLKHPLYQTYENNIKSLMTNDSSYKKIFDDTIESYLVRYCKRLNDPSSFNEERAHRLCLEYLLEECTVLCLWPETGCHFELYTNRHNAAVEETRQRFVFSKNPDLLQPVIIGFNHRKNLRPQVFETV